MRGVLDNGRLVLTKRLGKFICGCQSAKVSGFNEVIRARHCSHGA